MRTASCSITEGDIHGWHAVTLANSAIAVTVLPQKGADIYSFVDRASGIDALGKTPRGLQPPDSLPRADGRALEFLRNYEGAWQELLPNTLHRCVCDGVELPMHGEVATLPWSLRIDRNDDSEVAISLDVTCRQMPLALTRRMRLSRSAPVLSIEETLRNVSDRRVRFVWGHHPLLGAPFLEAGCRMSTADASVSIIEPAEPATATLAPGQRTRWPYARRIDDYMADLREIPGADANTHDHVYLSGFERAWVEVENPRLRLAFRLEWDAGVFRWLINWRPFGGSHLPPLDGIYGMAIEPWATPSNLAAAIEAGDALSLEGGQTLETWLKASLSSAQAAA